MKRDQAKAVIIIIMIIMVMETKSLANDDDGYSWSPRLYNGIYQEERNICIGIIIPEDGFDSTYSIGRHVFDWSNPVNLFEEIQLNKNDSRAEIISYFKDEHGNNIKLYLFVLIDVCLSDVEISYKYRLYDGPIPDNYPNDAAYSDVIGMKYYVIGKDCTEINEDVCNSMDLTEFYSWKADEDDDDTPEPDDDNDDTDSSDDDNDDDECSCGCDVSGRATSFPLALFMFAVGIVAWAISRRTLKK